MVGGSLAGGGRGRRNRNPEGSGRGLRTWSKVIKEDVAQSAGIPRHGEATDESEDEAIECARRGGSNNNNNNSAAAAAPSAVLSTAAAEFVPRGGLGGGLSAGAVDFKPGVGSSFSAGAAEFVPSTALSTRAAEFVPQQVAAASPWSGWTPQGGGAWGAARRPTGGWAAAGGYPAGFEAQGQPGCGVNADAYSDASSSSSSSNSPRDRTAARPGGAAGGAGGAAGGCGAGASGGGTAAEATASERASAALPSWSGMIDVVPFEPAKASTAPPSASGRPDPEATAPLSPRAAPASGTPAAAVLLHSPATAASERQAPTSESEAEWRLPEAFEAEMSERTLKMWFQRFANDGDSEALLAQWRGWQHAAAGAPREASSWLLRRGLDDCRSAELVSAILRHLLHSDAVSVQMVGELFDGCSGEEDLADAALDNPKVGEFVDAIRRLLDEKKLARTDDVVEDVNAESSCTDCVYTLRLLVAARRHADGTLLRSENDADPRWRTEPASALFKPAPSWLQHMAAHEGCVADDEADRRREGAAGSGGRTGRRSDPRAGDKSRQGDATAKSTLQVSKTSWVAQAKKWKEEKKVSTPDAAAMGDEDFVREMRAVLNKLTVEKFDRLSDQIISLVSQSARPNKGIPVIMQLVFEKATTQHHFINMYVNLCVKLHRWLTANEHISAIGSQGNFKRILLNQCQSSFENYLEPPDGFEGLKGSELYEAQVKYKTRMLGNIKLVGELIRNGMLAPKIALAVSAELARDDPGVREERLETLAVFLETVGPALDDKGWSHHAEFEAIFLKVLRMSKDQALPSRIRFLLRDLLDLRHGSWQVRRPRDLEAAAPTTIAQVHERARQGGETPASSVRSTPSRANAGREWGGLRSPQGGAADAAPRSREEQLASFKREITQTIRVLGEGGDPAAAVRRLRLCPPPADCALEEAADLLARVVDEPRLRRRQLFRLLPALFSGGILSPPGVLKLAVERFLQDAFADPSCVDPPDLGDIVLQEMLPALKLAPGSLALPPCVRELARVDTG